ncbi:uncharacterized protein LOC112327622 [Populus trichocarpa]|uniref:uncharacterized protein LOC112327622 n=1 Tax=Populus trichocarpa TaxID=3694 RepID=UPI00227822AF|nr:uncharacterized protein LOC112327622 [Populus trichocarpa]
MGGGGMLVGGPEFWQSIEILSHDPNLFVTSTLYEKAVNAVDIEFSISLNDGKYRVALGKWKAALNLMPENAVLHEQKAQGQLSWNLHGLRYDDAILLWCFCQAWVTLDRAQLNFGEPDRATENFLRAIAIKPDDSKEAQDDRHSASQLVKR